VHAVSVGEVMAAHPLIRDLRKNTQPEVHSLNGNLPELRQTARPEADAVFYSFDFPWIVRRVIRRQPGYRVVAETEWGKGAKAPAGSSALINGRISRDH
jgi:3-deoxy-D-manno-octulosonic-acid transferase